MKSDFVTLCEMDVGSIVKMIQTDLGGPVTQPDSDVGEMGAISGDHQSNIVVSQCDMGGLSIKSRDLNINLSKEVFEAIKSFLSKGTKND